MQSADRPRELSTVHLVKGEDLNHHQTLYGGRCAEWCVHAAYLTAENLFDHPQPLVFMSIRSLSMRMPARLGEMIEFVGRIDYIGESTIGVRIDAQTLQPRSDRKPVATGTFLFCTVDEKGRSIPHGLPPIAMSTGAQNRWKAAEKGATDGA